MSRAATDILEIKQVQTRSVLHPGGQVPTKTHLTDYLHSNALQTPDKLALITQDKQLTWAELWQQVEGRAAYIGSLLESDSQQVVGLLMPNTWQYVVSYLAIVHCGHIAMPVDVIYKPLEINAVIEQMSPALIITDQINKPRITSKVARVLDFADLADDTVSNRKPLRLPAKDQVASLIFTSGTTGKPKAAPYTHANHLWNIKACSRVWQWDSEDTLLISLRLSHWYGLVMGLSGALYHGNTLYLQENFDAAQTLKMLASGKVSLFTHGPVTYAKMLEVDGNYDLSSVRLCISGSAALPPVVWQNFKDRFNHEIVETYGSSETGRIAANPLDDRRVGSPGIVLDEVQVKFSAQGEVLIKSPGVFPGYWQNPVATKAATAAGDWWRTGDLGGLKDGRLVLRGRTHESIRRQGYTVSPRDVEWALHKNPDIKEALVVGTKSAADPNDKLVYFLVTSLSEDQVADFCKSNLPSVWRADRIIKVSKLPRTPSGKPDLTKLKAMTK